MRVCGSPAPYSSLARAFGETAMVISLDDTLKFFEFLACIDDVEKAFSLYVAAGVSITESTSGYLFSLFPTLPRPTLIPRYPPP